VHRLETSL